GSGYDYGYGIAVDGSGNAYVTGVTDGSLPTTTGAFQTTFGGVVDAFVTKLNVVGTTLVYSTYLGGTGADTGSGIVVDASGKAYVTGSTAAPFPTTNGAYQTTYGGVVDAFLTTLNAAGTALVDSTYLGGGGEDRGYGIAVDGSGNAYVTGNTFGSFPTTTGAYQTTFGGGIHDVFVAKVFDPELVNRTACAQAGVCASGLCIDGVCCDTACAGECQACDVAGHVGTCSPVAGAPHGTRTACGGSGTCAASCDGTNTKACTYPGPSTLCGSACRAGSETDSLCDGAGNCGVQAPRSCNNLVCADANTCKTTCTSAADCEIGFNCASDGTCQTGGACTDDHTSRGADGHEQECAPFKCDSSTGSGTSGTCKTQCASVDDCVAPTVCDPNGKCVSPPPASSDSGGCSCDTSSSSNGTPPWGTAVLALSVASLIVRNRRRRPAR
ncbi:MAG: SBBP repeat-containing protein, partial [Polyangiaceae bacterium]